MKLKILPPTLRLNNRYLVLDIKSEGKITKDDLVLATWDACVKFQGELGTSNFNLWVMKFFSFNSISKQMLNDYHTKFYYYRAILRCGRNFEDDVRVSLSLISKFNRKKLAITTIGTCGTIKSAVNKFIN
ncbi:Rpp14/Pop5 family protein [Methanobrevibacter filiformis]|uniref:Ribonuclease P protein component 2 n=1 Tax=Methanobrevibacter filiformis TaxID=55758 RepID=A0A166AZX8_9EURY|nr:Rpp14/Pop5 family protein [Methanobrevibacter filiformis]KZX12686.1 ribonuclease P protein component 2 [Methanobrevibacter filiformis]